MYIHKKIVKGITLCINCAMNSKFMQSVYKETAANYQSYSSLSMSNTISYKSKLEWYFNQRWFVFRSQSQKIHAVTKRVESWNITEVFLKNSFLLNIFIQHFLKRTYKVIYNIHIYIYIKLDKGYIYTYIYI